MTNVTKLERPLTAREQAQAELDAETRAKDVSTLKQKLRQLSAAQVVVANLEREILDIEAALKQGNEPT